MAKFSVYKQIFEFPDRYTAGHPITDKEAAVLNQQMGELISHRLRADAFADVTAGVEPTSEQIAAAQVQFATELEKFEFGAARVAGVPREPVDPVGKEAKRLATDNVRAKLKIAGFTLLKKDVEATSDKEYTLERFQAKVAEVAAMESVVKEARRIVAARGKVDVGEGFAL